MNRRNLFTGLAGLAVTAALPAAAKESLTLKLWVDFESFGPDGRPGYFLMTQVEGEPPKRQFMEYPEGMRELYHRALRRSAA
jgi:hypothetical protein